MIQIPGFIDLQVNGCKGVDFSNKTLTAEACAAACQVLLLRGTATQSSDSGIAVILSL